MPPLTTDAEANYVLSESERKEILLRMNKEHQKAWTNQSEARRRWQKLEDYCAGRQVWDSKNNLLVGHEIAGAPSQTNNVDDEFFIFNVLRRIHLSNVQRLSAYDIQVNVVPNSNDPGDKEGSRIARIALSDLLYRQGQKKLKRKIARICDLYGTVYLKVHFDPKAGPLIHPIESRPTPPTIDPTTGAIVAPAGTEQFVNVDKLVPQGEVVIDVISPRNILLPRFCRDASKAAWIEEVHVETCAWVYQNYDKQVDPEAIDFLTLWGPGQSDTRQPDTETSLYDPKDSVVVKSRYVRPCVEYQRGAIMVYTEKHLLRCTDLLTWYDEPPFFGATAIFDEKNACGESFLWDIIPIQEALNTDLTAIVNHVKMAGDLQWQAPAPSGIKEDSLSNATGKGVLYNGEKGVEYIHVPDVPATHFSVFNLLNQLGQSLGAAHDISRSNKALSGNALATLQQIDDTVLRPCVESIGEMLEKGCRLALTLMSEYYDTPRLIKMTGKKGWQLKEDFEGKMLADNFDAQISLMAGLSNNPLVRQESILKALKEEVISREEARAYLEFGNWDDLLEKIQKNEEVAQRVVNALADPEQYVNKPVIDPNTGLPVLDPRTNQPVMEPQPKSSPHEWDDMELLITALIDYMRENFDTMEPFMQKAFETRLKWYQQMMAALAMPAPSPAAASFQGKPVQLPPKPDKGNAAGPEAGADSVQKPEQQPSRDGKVPPAATGGAAV